MSKPSLQISEHTEAHAGSAQSDSMLALSSTPLPHTSPDGMAAVVSESSEPSPPGSNPQAASVKSRGIMAAPITAGSSS